MDPEFSKAFNLALRYLARRSKSIKEMERYLTGKNISSQVVVNVIDKLLTLKYLDDRTFAAQFIENRIRFKPKSTYALGYELRQKGIHPDLADELLANYDDVTLAFKAVDSKKGQWHHLDKETCRKKLMNYLRYRGFDHGACQAAWQYFQLDAKVKNTLS
jgi:regulatory protein